MLTRCRSPAPRRAAEAVCVVILIDSGRVAPFTLGRDDRNNDRKDAGDKDAR